MNCWCKNGGISFGTSEFSDAASRAAADPLVPAPSALAFDLCAAAGATLVGFARGDSHRVYCGAERLVSDAS